MRPRSHTEPLWRPLLSDDGNDVEEGSRLRSVSYSSPSRKRRESRLRTDSRSRSSQEPVDDGTGPASSAAASLMNIVNAVSQWTVTSIFDSQQPSSENKPNLDDVEGSDLDSEGASPTVDVTVWDDIRHSAQRNHYLGQWKMTGWISQKGVVEEEQKYSAYARLFKRPENPAFADDMELAVRAGVFMVILSMPLMTTNLPNFLEELLSSKMYEPETILYLMYGLYKTLGSTVELILCGIAGVALCLMTTYLMSATLPTGAGAGPEAFTMVTLLLAVLAGALFVVTLLALNMDSNAAIYGCNIFVGYWMTFLVKPAHGTVKEAQAEVVQQAKHEMLDVLVGSLFCFLCVMLPYPIRALDKSERAIQYLVRSLGEVWDQCNTYYCLPEPNVYKQQRLLKKLQTLQALLDSLERLHSDSWWECLAARRLRRKRCLLNLLRGVLVECYEVLHSAQQCCLTEQFEDKHKELMAIIGHSLKQVASDASVIMSLSARTAVKGFMSADDKENLKEAHDAARKSSQGFCKKFMLGKAQVGLPGISSEFMEEHAFCFAIASFSRIAIEFSEKLVESFELGKFDGDQERFFTGILNVCDPRLMFTRVRMKFVMRNALAIFAGMTLGFVGAPPMLNPHDAGVAAVSALLLTRSNISALAKNVSRVQGVVIGTVLGQIAYSSFSNCNLSEHIALSILIFTAVTASLFTYLHSGSNSTAYCAFTGGTFFIMLALARPCSDDNTRNVDKAVFYQKTVYVVFANLILVLVDLVFVPHRPSTQAQRELADAFDCIQTVLSNFFDDERSAVYFYEDDIKRHLAAATRFSDEASREPRLWRKPWNARLFNKALRCAASMNVTLCGIRHSLLAARSRRKDQNRDWDPQKGIRRFRTVKLTRFGKAALSMQISIDKPAAFGIVFQSQDWREMIELLLEAVEFVQSEMLDAFAPGAGQQHSQVSDEALEGWKERLDDFIERMGSQTEQLQALASHPELQKDFDASQVAYLEQDFCTQISVVGAAVSAMMTSLGKYKMSALKEFVQ